MLLSSYLARAYSTLQAQSCQEYLTYCQKANIRLSSRLFRGTFYEFQAKEALERHLHLSGLARVGGAGDNGIDLLGRWDLRCFQNPSSSADSPAQMPCDASGKVPVLIQCKNHATKIKASVIRELAGVHEYHVNGSLKSAVPTFMFLVSPLPLTKQAGVQMDTSQVPLIHVRISPMTRERSVRAEDAFLVLNWRNYTFGPAYMNNTARTLLLGLLVEKHHVFVRGYPLD